MPRKDPFSLIGKHLERRTSSGYIDRGTITTVLPDGRVVVLIRSGRTVTVDPLKNTEWELDE